MFYDTERYKAVIRGREERNKRYDKMDLMLRMLCNPEDPYSVNVKYYKTEEGFPDE